MRKRIHQLLDQMDLMKEFKTNCSTCSGLCCTALYFSKVDGFPYDKRAQTPCVHLKDTFLCDIHDSLIKHGCHGCRNYDCIGAGNEVTEHLYQGVTWREDTRKQKTIFDTFLTVYQLHQMLFYLCEAAMITEQLELQSAIKVKIEKLRSIKQSLSSLQSVDMTSLRTEVNPLLKQTYLQILPKNSKGILKNGSHHFNEKLTKQSLTYKNFSMSIMIGSDLSGSDLYGACFLGSDVRDVKVFSCDLSDCLYLTQAQVNTMRGNQDTRLPWYLDPPEYWCKG